MYVATTLPERQVRRANRSKCYGGGKLRKGIAMGLRTGLKKRSKYLQRVNG
jgi:hypothetical protein